MVFSIKDFSVAVDRKDNKSADGGFQGFIYSGQAGLTLDNVVATLATIHACNEFCDILTYSPLLVSQKAVFSI